MPMGVIPERRSRSDSHFFLDGNRLGGVLSTSITRGSTGWPVAALASAASSRATVVKTICLSQLTSARTLFGLSLKGCAAVIPPAGLYP